MSRGPAHRAPHRALEQLPPRDIDRLTALAASVPHDVTTGTLDPHVPPPRGWRRFSRSAVLDRTDLDALERELLSWAVQLRSGLQVAASDAPLRPGTVVLMRLGPWPFRFRIPCRVLELIEEPDLRGFAFATLPGHPETGIESFVLRHEEDGTVRFTVSAVSRPGTWFTRLGAPLLDVLQDRMTDRYLRALGTAAPGDPSIGLR